MGKTWTRKERSDRNRTGTHDRCGERPERVTTAWVMKRLARHIDYALSTLVTAEMIADADKEFYERIIEDDVRAGIDSYDAEKTDEVGRTTSAVHFFTVIVDHRVEMIRRYLDRICRSAKCVPISQLDPEQAEKFGYISEGSISDEARSVRELEFKMDINSLLGMLSVPEAITFRILMDGGTQEDAEKAVFLPGGTFRRKVMNPLRAKCRLCGFVPRKELEARHA